MPAARLRIAALVSIVTWAALGAAAEGQAARPRRQRDAAAEAADPVKLVQSKTLGATYGTLQFVDAEATADGHRTQFDPIPAGVALEVWLEGRPPRTLYVDEPGADPAAERRKVRRSCVSVLHIPDVEWDEFVASLKQVANESDMPTFRTVVLTTLLEQKMMLLHYRDELPAVEQRAAPAVQKLANGASFRQVVRVHSEDQTTAMVDGLLGDDTRGSLLDEYPLSKAIFELEPGELAGPIYTKVSAYLIRLDSYERAPQPRFDRAHTSGVVLRYSTGPNATPRELGDIRASVRVRTDQERFKLLVPPGIQVPPPKTFGPDDIAPLGQPDAPLKRIDLGG